MAFDFDSLPDDAKRAAFAKMKPGKGERPPADDSYIEAELQRIIRTYAKDGNPLHEGEIRPIRQELQRRRKVEELDRGQQELLKESTAQAARQDRIQVGGDGSQEEARGEITLTHAPDPPWLGQAFRDAFQDPVGRFEKYLQQMDAELDRMSLERMKGPTDWFKDVQIEHPLLWNQQFAQPLIPELPNRSLDLAPDSPFSDMQRFRSFDHADLPAMPEQDFYTQAADEIAYRFGLGPAFRDWLRKEGPKLGAEKMIDLTKQFAEYLEKRSGTSQTGSAGPGGPISPSGGQDGPGPLEFNVSGQKLRIPDFVVNAEVKFTADELVRKWRGLYRKYRRR